MNYNYKHTMSIPSDAAYFEGEMDFKVYADFTISGTPHQVEVQLENYQISGIIFGLEIDLTSEINWALNKPQNHRKKARFLHAIYNQLPIDTAGAWLQEEEDNCKGLPNED